MKAADRKLRQNTILGVISLALVIAVPVAMDIIKPESVAASESVAVEKPRPVVSEAEKLLVAQGEAVSRIATMNYALRDNKLPDLAHIKGATFCLAGMDKDSYDALWGTVDSVHYMGSSFGERNFALEFGVVGEMVFRGRKVRAIVFASEMGSTYWFVRPVGEDNIEGDLTLSPTGPGATNYSGRLSLSNPNVVMQEEMPVYVQMPCRSESAMSR